MKTIVIGNKVEIKKKFRSAFLCEITAQGVDFDNKTFHFIVKSEKIDALETLLSLIKKCRKGTYRHIGGYGEFFAGAVNNEDEELAEEESDLPYWPTIPRVGDSYYYSSHKYYWFDEDGVKHHAKVTDQEQ